MDRPNERDRGPDAPPLSIAVSASVTRTDNGGWIVTLYGGPEGERHYNAGELAHVNDIFAGVEWVSKSEAARLTRRQQQRQFIEGIAAGLPEGMRFGGVLGPFRADPDGEDA